MTNLSNHKLSRLSRGAYALLAASFLFFILYSAPHRVHHFFDQAQEVSQHDTGDRHGNTDHQNKSPTDSDCVFQASANRCAFGVTAQFQPLTLTQLVQDLLIFHDTTRPPQFLTAAFHIRAPPKA